MTAIVGLATAGGRVWIGADSAGVAGQSMTIRADAKAFTCGPFAFGFTTSFRMGQLIRYSLTPPDPPPDTDLHEFMCTVFVDALRDCLKAGGWAEKDKERESGGNFLVGVRGRLFEVWSDYQVAERAGRYTATGCGEDIALGSLYATDLFGWAPERRLQVALAAAARFSAGVRRPFRIVSVPDDAGVAAAGAAEQGVT